MRQLTRAQKKLLNEAFKNGARDMKSLPYEDWEKLQELNDTEILYQNADNYLRDLEWSERQELRSQTAVTR